MANTEESGGTQTAVIGTEHTLATYTTAGNRVLIADISALAVTEVVEFRIYVKVRTASTSKVYSIVSFAGPRGNDPVVVSVPIPYVFGGSVTLKQTTGTGRAIEWSSVLLG